MIITDRIGDKMYINDNNILYARATMNGLEMGLSGLHGLTTFWSYNVSREVADAILQNLHYGFEVEFAEDTVGV